MYTIIFNYKIFINVHAIIYYINQKLYYIKQKLYYLILKNKEYIFKIINKIGLSYLGREEQHNPCGLIRRR